MEGGDLNIGGRRLRGSKCYLQGRKGGLGKLLGEGGKIGSVDERCGGAKVIELSAGAGKIFVRGG